MATNDKRLTARELQILRWISAHQPATVRDAAAHFAAAEGLARTTILTVMERLRGQGYLNRRSSGGINRYRTTKSADTLQREVVDRFADEMFDGATTPFVAFLARNKRDLTTAEIDALRELVAGLDDRSRTRGRRR